MKKLAQLLLITVCIPLMSQEADRVTLVIDLHYPPFSFLQNEQGENRVEEIPPGSDSSCVSGFSWDIVREAFHAQGKTIVLHCFPWSRGKEMVAAGDIDGIFPFTRTPEREKVYQFAENPVGKDGVVVFFRKEQVVEWKGLQTLDHRRVGTITGWSYGVNFDRYDKCRKISVKSNLQNFLKLKNGKLFAVAGFSHSTAWYLSTQGDTDFFTQSPLIEDTATYLATGAETGKENQILSVFNRGFQIISENGILKSIEEKWKISLE